jgi:hypothetical protein
LRPTKAHGGEFGPSSRFRSEFLGAYLRYSRAIPRRICALFASTPSQVTRPRWYGRSDLALDPQPPHSCRNRDRRGIALSACRRLTLLQRIDIGDTHLVLVFTDIDDRERVAVGDLDHATDKRSGARVRREAARGQPSYALQRATAGQWSNSRWFAN